MTGPANSTTTRDGRTYQWDGETFTSVTTILNSIPKPWLTPWATRLSAEKAVELSRTGELQEALSQGRDREVIAAIRTASDEVRDAAADFGSVVHRTIERWILHEHAEEHVDVPPHVKGVFKQFLRFAEEHSPVWEKSEVTVYNRRYGYAGTLDAIAVINGRRLLIDFKTGKRVYPEHAAQLAAYAHGEWVGVPSPGGGFGACEQPVPKVDGGAVVHLRPRGYKVVEVDITERAFHAFLTALEMRRWERETSKQVLLGEIPSLKALDDAVRVFTEDTVSAYALEGWSI